MNRSEDQRLNIGPELLDLLVDGELADCERRTLLEQLERAPEGWRRCALAFLESQCWRDEFRTVAHQQPVEPASLETSRRPSRWRVAGRTLLAMAASFLLALGLGPVLRGLPWRTPLPGPSVADVAAVGPEVLTTSTSVALKPPLVPGGRTSAAASPTGPSAPGQSPWETITVAVPDGSGQGRQWIRIPVTQQDRLDSSWLAPAPDTLPAEVREMLQRAGCQVRHFRQLLPGSMEDGRRVVVPVDQVEVRYVGNHGYQ
ncbi:MAG: hypothetical protein ACLQNE_33165 [Thermoguttaceae bacterium]